MIQPSVVAQFKAWVDPGFDMVGLIDEARYEAFLWHVEQALVLVQDGRHALVTGDVNRIVFELDDDGHVVIQAEGQLLRVRELLWHTHPMTTGLSRADVEMLQRLGQDTSRIYEVGGPAEGTQYYCRRTS